MTEYDAARPTHWHRPNHISSRIDRIFFSVPTWIAIRSWQSVSLAAEPEELERREVSDHSPLALGWSSRSGGERARVKPIAGFITRDP
eukprot:9049154-Pyramimonas_sp.AAC.1